MTRRMSPSMERVYQTVTHPLTLAQIKHLLPDVKPATIDSAVYTLRNWGVLAVARQSTVKRGVQPRNVFVRADR